MGRQVVPVTRFPFLAKTGFEIRLLSRTRVQSTGGVKGAKFGPFCGPLLGAILGPFRGPLLSLLGGRFGTVLGVQVV